MKPTATSFDATLLDCDALVNFVEERIGEVKYESPYSPVETDFFRPVYCMLGLPIDAVTMDEALEKICAAARLHIRCFLSTPNLNFLVASQDNAEFRNSVIRSNLTVADGMPLVWIGRLIGVPIPERVAGSSLFERICKKTMRSMPVYFFGGPDGAAGEAAQNVNAMAVGAKCVGYQSPGFGSVDEMSREDLIEHINECRPDFLVVAMGAQKGQAWIEKNFLDIKAPVISHLGAVVNMAAGRIARAPVWVQRIGLEWLWRIKEEPALWRRYYDDAAGVVALLATRVLPAMLHNRFPGMSKEMFENAKVDVLHTGQSCRVTMMGPWRNAGLRALRIALTEATHVPADVTVDLHEVPYLDSAAIALLILLYGHQLKNGRNISFEGVTPRVRKIFKANCVEYMLSAEQ